MTDSHLSRSKRGKSRRQLHNSTYNLEALKSHDHHGQGNPNECGAGGAPGLLSEQDHSNTRIMDLQDDIPSRASSVGGSSANNMNHAQPNELEDRGGENQPERTFDMQSTVNDHMDQPHSGPIPLSMGALGPKSEETCQPQVNIPSNGTCLFCKYDYLDMIKGTNTQRNLLSILITN